MSRLGAAVRYEISEQGTTVEILVHDAAEHQPQLLASFQDCQSGSCSCPTDQYERLAAMAVDAAGGDVTLWLEPLAGQQFDTDQLRSCLDYTIAKAEQP